MNIIKEAVELGIKKAKAEILSPRQTRRLEYHLATDKPLTNEEMSEKLDIAVASVKEKMEEVIQLLFDRGIVVEWTTIREWYPLVGIQESQYLLGYQNDQPLNGFSDVRTVTAFAMKFMITPAGKMFPSCQVFCFADILGNLKMAESELMVDYKLAEFVKEVVFLKEMKRL